MRPRAIVPVTQPGAVSEQNGSPHALPMDAADANAIAEVITLSLQFLYDLLFLTCNKFRSIWRMKMSKKWNA